MTKCTGAGTIYSDVNFCPGSKSLPGVRGWVYGISKKDIVKWPTIGGEAPKSLADVAKYTGDFTLASDKKWHKVALIPNESQLQVESQGAYGSKTFKVTGTAVAPGTEEEITGYIAQANNDEMVYLFIQRNGKARMIGSEAFTPELALAGAGLYRRDVRRQSAALRKERRKHPQSRQNGRRLRRRRGGRDRPAGRP